MQQLVEHMVVIGTPAAIAIALTLRLPDFKDALWFTGLGSALAFFIVAMYFDPRDPYGMMALVVVAPFFVGYAIVVAVLTDAARTLVRRIAARTPGGSRRDSGPPPG